MQPTVAPSPRPGYAARRIVSKTVRPGSLPPAPAPPSVFQPQTPGSTAVAAAAAAAVALPSRAHLNIYQDDEGDEGDKDDEGDEGDEGDDLATRTPTQGRSSSSLPSPSSRDGGTTNAVAPGMSVEKVLLADFATAPMIRSPLQPLLASGGGSSLSGSTHTNTAAAPRAHLHPDSMSASISMSNTDASLQLIHKRVATKTDAKYRSRTRNNIIDHKSGSDTKSSSPNRVVYITERLLRKVSKVGRGSMAAVRALNLHLPKRSGSRNFGKIRFLENFHFVPALRELNLSYNAISCMENFAPLSQLRDLNLAENQIGPRIEDLKSLPHLRRLNLSGNRIQTLSPGAQWRSLSRLEELRLARNELSDLGEMRFLSTGLPNLRVLSIAGNPIDENPNTGVFVVFAIRSLDVLDGVAVTTTARKEAVSRFEDAEVALARSVAESALQKAADLEARLDEQRQIAIEHDLSATKSYFCRHVLCA